MFEEAPELSSVPLLFLFMDKAVYTSPTIIVVAFRCEAGFALSASPMTTETNPIRSEAGNGREIQHSEGGGWVIDNTDTESWF